MNTHFIGPLDHDDANDLLEFQDYTIQEFNRECLKLYTEREGEDEDECPKAMVRLVHFAISGRHPDLGHQAHVDALHFVPPDNTEFRLRTHIDSLICWTTSLQHITAPLHLSPLTKPFRPTIHATKEFNNFPGACTKFCFPFTCNANHMNVTA
jgi:hypothetical protein